MLKNTVLENNLQTLKAQKYIHDVYGIFFVFCLKNKKHLMWPPC